GSLVAQHLIEMGAANYVGKENGELDILAHTLPDWTSRGRLTAAPCQFGIIARCHNVTLEPCPRRTRECGLPRAYRLRPRRGSVAVRSRGFRALAAPLKGYCRTRRRRVGRLGRPPCGLE